MFRIKPIRNQTTAKYTYHNQNNIIQSKINVPVKLTFLNHQPVNQIANPQKITQPLKKSINPLSTNQVTQVSFIRSQKPQEKTLLKRNVVNNQHKLKIPQTNQIPLKKIEPTQNSRLNNNQKKQQVTQKSLIHENAKNILNEKNVIIKDQKFKQQQYIQVPKVKSNNQQQNIIKTSNAIKESKLQESTFIPVVQKSQQHQKLQLHVHQIPQIKNQPQQQKQEPKQQKVDVQQKTHERQKQMQDLVLKIQKRRQARQKQKLRIREMEQKRKQNEQRALQFMNQRNLNGQNNQGVAGMLQLNDQLMHFSLAESIMDLQIKKLLKTNFNDFPNASQIKYQIEELQRINMSYEMVRMDEQNPLRNGLKNYRVEMFNRIGEEIMKAQAQGYSNPNFHIMQHDGRISQPQNSNIPQAIRGVPKENQDNFIKYEQNNEDQECTICLGDIKNLQIVAKLQCGHSFHTNCIKQWVQSSANCPTCRFNIKFGPKRV